jgi:hypothetical protein
LPTFDRFGVFSQAFSERVLNARFLDPNSDTAVSRDNCRHRIAKLRRNRSDKSATVKLRDAVTLVVEQQKTSDYGPIWAFFLHEMLQRESVSFATQQGVTFESISVF